MIFAITIRSYVSDAVDIDAMGNPVRRLQVLVTQAVHHEGVQTLL